MADFSSGFKIESDGTAAGTKVYDAKGNLIPFLTKLEVSIDAQRENIKVMPSYSFCRKTPAVHPKNPHDD